MQKSQIRLADHQDGVQPGQSTANYIVWHLKYEYFVPIIPNHVRLRRQNIARNSIRCLVALRQDGLVLVSWCSTVTILENLEGDNGLLATDKWTGGSVSGAYAAVVHGLLFSRVSARTIKIITNLAITTGQALLGPIPIGQTNWASAFLIMLVTPWGI
jgi:hypothetical protein